MTDEELDEAVDIPLSVDDVEHDNELFMLICLVHVCSHIREA